MACKWGEIGAVPRIKMLPGERHRERVVSFEEEGRYLSAAREPLASIGAVLVDTGLRPEECYRLMWESIAWCNGRNGTLLCYARQDKGSQKGYSHDAQSTYVEQRWEYAGKPLEGWVWPAPTRSGHVEPSSLKKQHRKALPIAGVRELVLYSLRHTFLARLGESGCDAWTLARIAGHSSITISARYVHPSENAVLDAVERLGGHKSGHSQIRSN
jgi:integrase